MVEIVPTKVTTENGPIKVGALRGTDKNALTGAVVGKALGRWPSGNGLIEVLVSLQ